MGIAAPFLLSVVKASCPASLLEGVARAIWRESWGLVTSAHLGSLCVLDGGGVCGGGGGGVWKTSCQARWRYGNMKEKCMGSTQSAAPVIR